MESLKYSPKVEIVPDPDALAARSVEIFLADANKSIDACGVFYAAISGGQTPRGFFEMLGKITASQEALWKFVRLFWVDERYVRIDSPESNYRVALETFLSKVPIPQENINRISTENSDVHNAACVYEDRIRKVFAVKAGQIPKFDLIILGMGKDGHTGSLFPKSYADIDANLLAGVVYSPVEKLSRITLTSKVLCAAAHLLVLVAGKEKASILKEVMTSEPDELRYPIHTLWPVLDRVTWLIDKQAARLLA
jgi:6-phosphogluconolactonase